MDPRYCAQDVLLCDLCDKDVLQSHCEPCRINLCLNCVGKHLSDPSKRHNVVPYRQRKMEQQQSFSPNYPKCPQHAQKLCELYCESCDIPVCSICLSSGKHKGHNLSDVLQKHSSKKEVLEKDLAELKQRIHPTYQHIASDVKAVKANLEKHYGELTTLVINQGEDWHKEIEIIVKRRKFDIEEMRTKHLEALEKQEDEITPKLSEIEQSISDLEKILASNDVFLASTYKSRNAEFRKLPPKLKAALPIFSPPKINTQQLSHLFGSPSALSITADDLGYTMKTTEPQSSPPVRPLLDKPELITAIFTKFADIASISCLNEDEIWTSALWSNMMMKLYNLQGELLMSIKSKSGNNIGDITVTKSGDLVYTDPDARTVNIVKNKQIKAVIRLQGWIPLFVCSTSSDELLVTMMSGDAEGQSKVVRYSGSAAKQTIQFDDKGVPLYSSSSFSKYICENKNLDICVADTEAMAIVVVNQDGKLRFRYTGCPLLNREPFCPYGITTDSQGQILTSENQRHFVHILDQNGQFLRFLENCNLRHPWGLCVDKKDHLFVAQRSNGEVKKIKYM